MIKFEWDENKNLINQAKHGVSFQESISVFYDDDALLLYDPDHSDYEDRFLIIGLSFKANMLVACHCCREDNIIRIISSRKATKNEKAKYIERINL